MHLNLGCGYNFLRGFINVDKYNIWNTPYFSTYGEDGGEGGTIVYDLESLPWPWPNDSVEEIRMSHILEHLGQTVDVYLNIWKEIYRVCQDGSTIKITVPHPKHDDFINDPTHIRPITPEGIALLSKAKCREFKDGNFSNTQLAFMLDVNFEMTEVVLIRDANVQEVKAMQCEYYNNIFKEIRMTLKVVKNETLWGFEVKS